MCVPLPSHSRVANFDYSPETRAESDWRAGGGAELLGRHWLSLQLLPGRISLLETEAVPCRV